ncbi:MAG: hypothetical protein P4L45_11005 [Ignavibacteriaceae bacterium]|nr:hypothetical protein [Ignavibacteriaceae bacterium]
MKTLVYLGSFLLVFLTACSSLVLKPADFSWPVESVLNIDNDGNVAVERYSESFNAKMLFYKETGDSLSYQNKQLRVIRNRDGYYFMVADNFKNVYVFNDREGGLRLERKIEISDSAGVQNPAFNQRNPFIELVYGENSTNKINLTSNGIRKEE